MWAIVARQRQPDLRRPLLIVLPLDAVFTNHINVLDGMIARWTAADKHEYGGEFDNKRYTRAIFTYFRYRSTHVHRRGWQQPLQARLQRRGLGLIHVHIRNAGATGRACQVR
jgi:hypothetical protein